MIHAQNAFAANAAMMGTLGPWDFTLLAARHSPRHPTKEAGLRSDVPVLVQPPLRNKTWITERTTQEAPQGQKPKSIEEKGAEECHFNRLTFPASQPSQHKDAIEGIPFKAENSQDQKHWTD